MGKFDLMLVLLLDRSLTCERVCARAPCSDFPTNKCLPTSSSGYYIVVNCSSTGTMLNEYIFQTKTCTGQAHSASIKTNTCTPINGGGFAEWSCVAGGAKVHAAAVAFEETA